MSIVKNVTLSASDSKDRLLSSRDSLLEKSLDSFFTIEICSRPEVNFRITDKCSDGIKVILCLFLPSCQVF